MKMKNKLDTTLNRSFMNTASIFISICSITYMYILCLSAVVFILILLSEDFLWVRVSHKRTHCTQCVHMLTGVSGVWNAPRTYR